jgi:hypothetical protein
LQKDFSHQSTSQFYFAMVAVCTRIAQIRMIVDDDSFAYDHFIPETEPRAVQEAASARPPFRP